jgi:hypothetical protein
MFVDSNRLDPGRGGPIHTDHFELINSRIINRTGIINGARKGAWQGQRRNKPPANKYPLAAPSGQPHHQTNPIRVTQWI